MGLTQPQEYNAPTKTFFIVHDDIFNHLLDNVSAPAHRLYDLLRTYSNSDYKAVYPKVSTLASRMKVSEDSITRYLRELEKADVIRIQRKKKNNRNLYHFTTPDKFGDPSAPKPRKRTDEYPANRPKSNPQPCGYNNHINLEPDPITTTKQVVVDIDNQSTQNNKPDPIPDVDKNQDTQDKTPSDPIPDKKTLEQRQTELIDKHKQLLDQLQNPPLLKPLPIETSIQSGFEKKHGKDFSDFILDYAKWVIHVDRVDLLKPIGFINYLFGNIHTHDFSKYFKYLQSQIDKQKRQIQNQIKVNKKQFEERIRDEYHKYSKPIYDKIKADPDFDKNYQDNLSELLESSTFMKQRYMRNPNGELIHKQVLYRLFEKKGGIDFDQFEQDWLDKNGGSC